MRRGDVRSLVRLFKLDDEGHGIDEADDALEIELKAMPRRDDRWVTVNA